MIGETALRFLLGGTIVALFALVGALFRPPSFAGIFGSAPSLALATLLMAFATRGSSYAATEARAMMIGAAGLVAYGAVCRWVVARADVPVWAGAALCWIVWFVVTFGLWAGLSEVVS